MRNLIVNGDFSAGVSGWTVPASGTLVVDTAVFDAVAPSAKLTWASTPPLWCGITQGIFPLPSNRRFEYSIRVRANAGLKMTASVDFYNDSSRTTWLSDNSFSFTGTGAWQTVSNIVVLPAACKLIDLGIFFDANPTQVGAVLNVDNIAVFSLDDDGPTSLVIPPETTYSDIERDLIDNEPPGLFPGDQISVWGQVRKVYADYMQFNLADKLNKWYLNLDPSTVDIDDLPEWEYMLNTPANGNLSIAARQAFLISRREQGAFTRARRRRIVEAFITATFGVATDFTVDGLPLDNSIDGILGIPMYSGATSLAGAYTIREPQDNLAPNPSFETDASGWGASTGATIARSTAAAKYGAACGLATATVNTDVWVYPANFPMPVVGKAYSASIWVRRVSGARQCLFEILFANADWSQQVSVNNGYTLVPTGSFVQLKAENAVAPPWATQAVALFDMNGGTMAVGDSFYIDGAMFEAQPVAREYVDPYANPFSYDVRILNTITVDQPGLTRELQRITPSGISFTITSTPTP